MDIFQFISLIRQEPNRGQFSGLEKLVLEAGLLDNSNNPTARIIRWVEHGLENSKFTETQVLQALSPVTLGQALSSVPRISENGVDTMAFNILNAIGLLTPPFCPPCHKENAEQARHCIWCGKGFPNIYCPNCKTRNVVEAIYCMECGQER